MPTAKGKPSPRFNGSPAVPVAPRLIIGLQRVSLIYYKKDSLDRDHKCNRHQTLKIIKCVDRGGSNLLSDVWLVVL